MDDQRAVKMGKMMELLLVNLMEKKMVSY